MLLDEEPTACLENDLMALREIETAHAAYVAAIEAAMAKFECTPTEYLMREMLDTVAIARTDVLNGAIKTIEEAYDEREWGTR